MAATIGDRLGELRLRRGLTQEGLAEKAQLSIDTVRKLEQNQRLTARMGTLNSLARALDVETSVLLGAPAVLASSNGSEPPSLLTLRQAVTPLSEFAGLGDEEDTPPPSVAQLRAGIRSTEQIRRRGELTKITALLPVLLTDARAAVREYTDDGRAAAYAVLAEAYQVAATTLTAFGKEDAAYTAIERSMAAARQSDDPRLEIMGVSSLSWIFSKQGRISDAEQVADGGTHRARLSFGPDRPLAVGNSASARCFSSCTRRTQRQRRGTALSRRCGRSENRERPP
ncbi:helix-turn-helix domain-containing protein [Streptomyces sp. NPDC054841]